jgi:hypothetical protein
MRMMLFLLVHDVDFYHDDDDDDSVVSNLQNIAEMREFLDTF